MIESRGFKVSDAEALFVIRKFDSNRDGLVRFNEVSQRVG
jgi:hypothetical protein